MSESTKAEVAAIGAVARRFSATWQSGEGPPDAYLTVDGRKIALDVAVVAARERSGGRKHLAKARLREDRVAQSVLRDIEEVVGARVPEGKTVILTLGAPIKVAKKLVAALTGVILSYLEGGAAEVDEKRTLLGNRVRFRVLNNDPQWTAKVVGFVFSGDPAPGALAHAMRSLHDQVAMKSKQRRAGQRGAGRFAGDRWLVLIADHWIADIKTYRRAYSRRLARHSFRKVLMVFAGGRVETLTDAPWARRRSL